MLSNASLCNCSRGRYPRRLQAQPNELARQRLQRGLSDDDSICRSMIHLMDALSERWARYKFCLSKVEIKCVSGSNNPLFIRLEARYGEYCIGFISVVFMNRHCIGDIPEREAIMQVLKERYAECAQDKLVYVADIHVEQRYRNCRVGRMLFRHAIKQASRKIEKKSALLGVARTEQARGFLKCCGFDVVREFASVSIMISEFDRHMPMLEA